MHGISFLGTPKTLHELNEKLSHAIPHREEFELNKSSPIFIMRFFSTLEFRLRNFPDRTSIVELTAFQKNVALLLPITPANKDIYQLFLRNITPAHQLQPERPSAFVVRAMFKDLMGHLVETVSEKHLVRFTEAAKLCPANGPLEILTQSQTMLSLLFFEDRLMSMASQVSRMAEQRAALSKEYHSLELEVSDSLPFQLQSRAIYEMIDTTKDLAVLTSLHQMLVAAKAKRAICYLKAKLAQIQLEPLERQFRDFAESAFPLSTLVRHVNYRRYLPSRDVVIPLGNVLIRLIEQYLLHPSEEMTDPSFYEKLTRVLETYQQTRDSQRDLYNLVADKLFSTIRSLKNRNTTKDYMANISPLFESDAEILSKTLRDPKVLALPNIDFLLSTAIPKPFKLGKDFPYRYGAIVAKWMEKSTLEPSQGFSRLADRFYDCGNSWKDEKLGTFYVLAAELNGKLGSIVYCIDAAGVCYYRTCHQRNKEWLLEKMGKGSFKTEDFLELPFANEDLARHDEATLTEDCPDSYKVDATGTVVITDRRLNVSLKIFPTMPLF